MQEAHKLIEADKEMRSSELGDGDPSAGPVREFENQITEKPRVRRNRWFEAFCQLAGCSGWFCLQRNSAEPRADRFQDGDMSATYDSVHRGRLSEHRYSAAYDFVPRR